jgi:ankyrin repeat protein
VNLTRPGKDSWLKSVVWRNDLEGIKVLLACGVRTNIPDDSGYLPLQVAAYKGHVDAIRLLVEGGAKPDWSTGAVAPAIWVAMRNNQVEAVRELLARGASPHVTVSGWSALQRAAFDGQVEIIRALIAAGADPNAASPQAPPPLFIAAQHGKAGAAAALIDAGADVHATVGAWTPIGVANRFGRQEVATLLASRGGH